MHFNVTGLIRKKCIPLDIKTSKRFDAKHRNRLSKCDNTTFRSEINNCTTSEEFASETIQRWIICIQEILYQRPKERSKTKLIICKWMIILKISDMEILFIF